LQFPNLKWKTKILARHLHQQARHGHRSSTTSQKHWIRATKIDLDAQGALEVAQDVHDRIKLSGHLMGKDHNIVYIQRNLAQSHPRL
jgi:hypothetical protein